MIGLQRVRLRLYLKSGAVGAIVIELLRWDSAEAVICF